MRSLALAVIVAVLVGGCALPAPQPPTATAAPTPTLPTEPTLPMTPGTIVTPFLHEPAFDGERALGWVREQVTAVDGSARYRIPGTPGNEEVARLIDAEMSRLGFAVTWHHFNATYGCEEVAMHNLVAERAGTSGRIVVFAAHYDTRPISDKDPVIADRSLPVLGANDGASGVGVLLELARVLPASNDTMRFLFFDGEDGGGYKGRSCTDWILGSRAYATSLPQQEVDAMAALVLVDMIGDPHLRLPKEGYSAADEDAAAIQSQIYTVGQLLGHDAFENNPGPSILDDHVPFLERMVPAVDLIHTIPGSAGVFPAWHHTQDDDMDVVSAASLDQVGETIETWVVSRR